MAVDHNHHHTCHEQNQVDSHIAVTTVLLIEIDKKASDRSELPVRCLVIDRISNGVIIQKKFEYEQNEDQRVVDNQNGIAVDQLLTDRNITDYRICRILDGICNGACFHASSV